MENTRNGLLAKLRALIGELGLTEKKSETYRPYGVKNDTDMTDYQLRHLIAALEGKDVGPGFIVPFLTAGPMTKQLRSQCLCVITGDPNASNPRKRGLGFVPNDWENINRFVQNHAGAKLNQLTDGELETLKHKLYAMRSSGWKFKRDEMPQPRDTVIHYPILPPPGGLVN